MTLKPRPGATHPASRARPEVPKVEPSTLVQDRGSEPDRIAVGRQAHRVPEPASEVRPRPSPVPKQVGDEVVLEVVLPRGGEGRWAVRSRQGLAHASPPW